MAAIPNRVAIYARISLDRAGDAAGVGRQLEDCRQLVARHPEWSMADLPGTVLPDGERLGPGELGDNDISATSGKRRPEYERLMAAVGRGEANVIVVYMLSRLWRNRKERSAAMEKLAAVKGRIVTVKGPDLDLSTATGRMLLDLMGAFDTFEVEVKGERQRRQALEAAERGAYHGTRPFGYQIVDTVDGRGRKLRTLTPDPAEAALVAEAAQRVVEGDSLRSIGLDWAARGIPTVHGGTWGKRVVRSILLAPRNAALRVHEPGRKGGPASADAPLHPASWPPILDRDTYDEVVEILTDPGRRNTTSLARINLLASFVVCGKCGAPMAGKPRGGRRTYICQPPPDGCSGMGRLAAAVDREVERTVFHWLEDNGLYDQARAAVDTDAVRGLQRRRRELQTRRNRFDDYLADGTWTKAQYGRQCRRVDAEAAEIGRALSRHVGTQFMDTVPERGGEFAHKWERSASDGARGLEWRRKVIGALVDRVVVHAAYGGRAPFDATRLQIFPAAWAAQLADPSAANPQPVDPLPPAADPVRDYLTERPGQPLTAYEVADAIDRSYSSTRYHLEKLVAAGVADRAGRRHLGTSGHPQQQYTIGVTTCRTSKTADPGMTDYPPQNANGYSPADRRTSTLSLPA